MWSWVSVRREAGSLSHCLLFCSCQKLLLHSKLDFNLWALKRDQERWWQKLSRTLQQRWQPGNRAGGRERGGNRAGEGRGRSGGWGEEGEEGRRQGGEEDEKEWGWGRGWEEGVRKGGAEGGGGGDRNISLSCSITTEKSFISVWWGIVFYISNEQICSHSMSDLIDQLKSVNHKQLLHSFSQVIVRCSTSSLHVVFCCFLKGVCVCWGRVLFSWQCEIMRLYLQASAVITS